MLWFLLTIIFYLTIKWLKYYRFPSDFPPGPPCVPFIGSLPFIKTNFKETMQQWRRDYGDVVGLSLGTELVVVISDFELLTKAFRDSRLTGRPKNLQKIMRAFFDSPTKDGNPDSHGIVFSHGEMWREQRRFALRTLKDRGFSNHSMEASILSEVEELATVLKKSDSKTPAPARKKSSVINKSLSVAVVNSLSSILTSEKIHHGDHRVEKIVNGTDHFIRNESLNGILMVFPWLRHLPYFRTKFCASKESPQEMRRMQDDIVQRRCSRKESMTSFALTPAELDKYEENKDFIDAYLDKITSTKDQNSSFYGHQGLTNLQRSLTDLFGAGSETSSSVLLFAFLYMIKYPQVQARVQQEIEDITVNRLHRKISMSDRRVMPYTEAVIFEILRHSSLVYTVPQATTDPIDVAEFHLPRETTVYANLWHVMHDPDYWTDPEKFDPQRFLDEEGHFKRDERCIPFMTGRRFCLGQSLAENQLFLFFTGILQRFELVAPDGPESVSTAPLVGFIHRCPVYDIEFHPRLQEEPCDQPFPGSDG